MCAEHARTKTRKASKRPAPLGDELAAGALLVHSIGASTGYEIFVTELCADPAAGELAAFANNVHVALLAHAWITGKKSAIFSFVLHARHNVSNIVICASSTKNEIHAAADDPRLKETELTVELVGTMLKRAKSPVTTFVVEPAPGDEALKISQVTADTVIAGLAMFYGLG
jgi:hypothetical protein